jgi:4-amino-4-deoxy-L-arabinose transferase-like glycosyltransferase
VLALMPSIAAWAVLFACIPPGQQDFPLADDWSFAQGCFRFAKGEGIHYGQWAAMPLLGQWAWATPFVRAVGENHFALRLSTIVLGWLGLCAFFDLLRQEDVPTKIATFATATLALNPLFFLLQGTFMTDVPALALALIALAIYGRAMRDRRISMLLAGSLMAVAAVVTRQTTIVVPLTAGVLLYRQRDLRGRVLYWLAVIVPLVVGVWVHNWFQARPDVIRADTRVPSIEIGLVWLFAIVHLCGLASVPVLLLAPAPSLWAGFLLASGVMLGGALYWFFHPHFLMVGGLFPYIDGIITTRGAYMGDSGRPMLLDRPEQACLTILGCIAAGALAWRLVDRLHGGWRPGPLLLFGLMQVPLIMAAPSVFDRYLLPLFPGAFSIAVAGLTSRGRQMFLAGAVLAVFGIVAVCLSHDWLACNAARWALGKRIASERGVAASEIDGNFEWNGWWYDAQSRPASLRLVCCPTRDRTDRESEPYTQWLPPGRRQFVLLEPGDEMPANP